jgi:hypothetical protein
MTVANWVWSDIVDPDIDSLLAVIESASRTHVDALRDTIMGYCANAFSLTVKIAVSTAGLPRSRLI